jgi:nucleotide-binding universal stress UspA family protein
MVGHDVALTPGMTFTKILCPTDFSPGAQRAVREATRLARDAGAELVIAHCWYIPASAYSLEAPFPAYFTQQIVDDAQRDLDAAVAEATAAGASRVSGKLLVGVPWAEIVTLLEHEAFDLCVVGTHGRTGLARILVGSVAEKVIRHSPCSTLAVRPDGEAKPFTHALVPTDFSQSAAYALELAANVMQPRGAITVLHVVELPIMSSGDVPDQDFARDLDNRAALTLDQAVASMRTQTEIKVAACTRIGYPGAEVLAAVDDDPTIDLVVMGSHGRTGIKRALIGSVAEKIARHARCPVLVARKRA